MPGYWLHLHHPDDDGAERRVTGDSPAALAQQVHHHARGFLASTRVDVRIDPGTLTGSITSHGATAATFTLQPVEEPDLSPPSRPLVGEVKHGYTLADVHRLTQLVIRLDRWAVAGDLDERRDAVWFAIVERLLTADEPPTRGELLRVGTEASDVLVRDEMRTHGRCTLNIGQPMPRFHAYWGPTYTPSPEPRIVERHALGQIWPLLRPSEQRALTALAATGDYEQAAAACGVAKGTFQVLVSTGRRRFFKAWHEGEKPSRQWRTDRRVRSRDGRHLGRRRLTATQVDGYRERYYAGEKLRALAAECGLTVTGLSRLIKGQSKPAKDAA
jgi:hypothetical protein